MGVTKAALIAVGTVGGLGAVLAYQPPHQTSSFGAGGFKGSGGVAKTTPAATDTPAATPTETVAATPTPTTEKTTPAAKATTPAPKKTTPAAKATTPAPKATKAAPKPAPKKTKPAKAAAVNGTFAGAISKTVYGPVQVQIKVVNNKIVDVSALQLPTAQPYDIQLNESSVPLLISQTLAAQSSDIQGVSGASYTSQGWYDSLVSALAKAGL